MVEYRDHERNDEVNVTPAVNDYFEKIGQEALNESTKTLDSIYGEDKVEKTFHKTDD